MKSRKSGNRRGVSLSVTIGLFIVAVSVIVAIAIWMGGATGQLTKFEKIEIQSAVCSLSEGNWTIKIKLRNIGTGDTAITSVFINDEEVDEYSQVDAGYVFNDKWATNMTQSEAINSGESICALVYIDPHRAGSSLTSRTRISVTIHTLMGTGYPKVIKLT